MGNSATTTDSTIEFSRFGIRKEQLKHNLGQALIEAVEDAYTYVSGVVCSLSATMQYSLSLPKYSNSSSEFTPLASFLDARAYDKIASWGTTTDALAPRYREIDAKYADQIAAATGEAQTALIAERDNEKADAKETYVNSKVNALDSSRFTEFFNRLNYKLHSEAGFDLEDISNDTGDWIKLSWIFKDSDATLTTVSTPTTTTSTTEGTGA